MNEDDQHRQNHEGLINCPRQVNCNMIQGLYCCDVLTLTTRCVSVLVRWVRRCRKCPKLTGSEKRDRVQGRGRGKREGGRKAGRRRAREERGKREKAGKCVSQGKMEEERGRGDESERVRFSFFLSYGKHSLSPPNSHSTLNVLDVKGFNFSRHNKNCKHVFAFPFLVLFRR